MDFVGRRSTSSVNTLNKKLVRKCSTIISHVPRCIFNSFEVVRNQLPADQQWPAVFFFLILPLKKGVASLRAEGFMNKIPRPLGTPFSKGGFKLLNQHPLSLTQNSFLLL